jgi:hypothetical protein
MTLFVLAYVASVLTILSPCILPVLPFVFARADRSFLRTGLPLLVGMAFTFASPRSPRWRAVGRSKQTAGGGSRRSCSWLCSASRSYSLTWPTA